MKTVRGMPERAGYNRRELLRGSLTSAGLYLFGLHKLALPSLSLDVDPFRGGKRIGVVPFSDESDVPMGRPLGSELDGRLFTDLSALTPENSITPVGDFYVRTRASKLLDTNEPWSIQLGGMVDQPQTINLRDMEKIVRPMGVHLMECAGNFRGAHFGMLSVADWEGVPLAEVLKTVKVQPVGARVLVSGFDHYAGESRSSIPGASWIFTPEQLESAHAFLATKMNGQPLTPDHGAPVRLLVPGWYGCACIKWVNEISFVVDETPTTSQMQEYAARTMQEGIPALAKNYAPATIDFAAIPIRIEKWMVEGKTKFRVVGIQWGGSRPIDGLKIQFNSQEEFQSVEDLHFSTRESWNFWTHAWTPQKPGRYLIRLQLKDRSIVARRLSSGYYMRSVEITEI
jgi:DMSO/TMAO reductase YedYZ molybdopterin-dependent catalytic subunit